MTTLTLIFPTVALNRRKILCCRTIIFTPLQKGREKRFKNILFIKSRSFRCDVNLLVPICGLIHDVKAVFSPDGAHKLSASF